MSFGRMMSPSRVLLLRLGPDSSPMGLHKEEDLEKVGPSGRPLGPLRLYPIKGLIACSGSCSTTAICQEGDRAQGAARACVALSGLLASKTVS